MRILIVSQMWPGPSDPDLGSFVATNAAALEALGHDVDRAVIDHRGGSRLKYPRLCLDAVRGARRMVGPAKKRKTPKRRAKVRKAVKRKAAAKRKPARKTTVRRKKR